jgi:hypothetical protein
MVHRMMAGKSNDCLYVTTSPITVIFSTWLFKDQGKCHGFETVASIGFICRRSMCGSSVDRTLKKCMGHDRFNLVRASGPHVQ